MFFTQSKLFKISSYEIVAKVTQTDFRNDTIRNWQRDQVI